jgi:hypothetical protein
MKRRLILIAFPLLAASAAQGQLVTTGNVTATSLNVATLNTGTVLHVAPAVSPDGRYVTMGIDVQSAVLDGIDTFVLNNGPGTIGGTGAGGVLGVPGVPQPVAIKRIPFRQAQVGNVVFVDHDKPLLAARVPACDWPGVSIKTALRKLADASHENIVLGNHGLEQSGADVNAAADYAFPAGTVKDALLAILKTAVPRKEMVVTSEDKVIEVMTQGQADQVLVSKTYYLRDVLAALPRFVKGGTNLNEIGSGAVSDCGELSQPLDLSKPPENKEKAKLKAAAAPNSTNILEVITDTVRPEIWRNHGGKSEIALVGNYVTIKAPASVHVLLDVPRVYNPNRVRSYGDDGSN